VYRFDWQSWPFYLGTVDRFYLFDAARECVRRKGIKSSFDYQKRRQEDERLPSDPAKYYVSQWKGWDDFLGRESFYSFSEAKKIVRENHVKDREEYKAFRKKFPRLPSNPNIYYESEWKGSLDFFGHGKRSKFYQTLKQASRAARKLGIMRKEDYATMRKLDPQLPSSPPTFYASAWKGWPHFLGKKKPKKS
jgi:hypothetical protein